MQALGSRESEGRARCFRRLSNGLDVVRVFASQCSDTRQCLIELYHGIDRSPYDPLRPVDRSTYTHVVQRDARKRALQFRALLARELVEAIGQCACGRARLPRFIFDPTERLAVLFRIDLARIQFNVQVVDALVKGRRSGAHLVQLALQ